MRSIVARIVCEIKNIVIYKCMTFERVSLVYSSFLFYGLTGGLMIWDRYDNLYGYYALFLAFFSGLYHFYDEKKFFAEDFICSFFFKLHVVTNYVVWVSWQGFLFYSFLSEVIGLSLFCLSFASWKYKNRNYCYMIVHNIWHIYTGLLPYMVVRNEERVGLGYVDNLFMMLFVVCMTNYNLKKNLYVKGLIFGSLYLWNLGNFYNLLSLVVLHSAYYMKEKLISF